ncbi:GIY-YIG nuclease family protein [Thermoanaerobacterium thermosaccharolyticum]|uniref:GIY-YIG nuclease family protein n=1 Tax=Thermoanaerobacterium thermosaccharolyticum TaxID=1517 RepID=UPI002FDA18E3
MLEKIRLLERENEMLNRVLKRAVIREELMVISDDFFEAIILNQMLYWTEKADDYDQYVEEEKARIQQYTISLQNTSTLSHGWIYKTAKELKEELMNITSEDTINRTLNNLVKKDFLNRRNNPKNKYDRTYQYRVNLKNILATLIKKGILKNKGVIRMTKEEFIQFLTKTESIHISYDSKTNTFFPHDQGGFIYTKKAFIEKVNELLKFYDFYSDETIENYNNQLLDNFRKPQRENKSRYERIPRKGYIYFFEAENGLIKIGQTQNLLQRYKDINNNSFHKINFLFAFKNNDITKTEKELHKIFGKYRYKGEWFIISKNKINALKNLLKQKNFEIIEDINSIGGSY